jgi:hypothetical protein
LRRNGNDPWFGPMRRVASMLALVLAWVCAQGVLLEVAQVIAWSRMFAGFADTMRVADAVKETFDPANACPMCRAIEKAREAERGKAPVAPNAPEDAAKLVLVCASVDTVVYPPSLGDLLIERSTAPSEWHPQVPKPRPRTIARAASAGWLTVLGT